MEASEAGRYTAYTEVRRVPHGYCYRWLPDIVWLHVVSDALIVLAYYSIPFTLFYFARQRKDLVFRWMYLCFGAFILACGTTHLFSIYNVWHAEYRLDGAVKAVTAALSIGTAFLLVRLVPEAVRLPSPAQIEAANAQIRSLNAELARKIEERSEALQRSEAKFRSMIEHLPSGAIYREGGAWTMNRAAEGITGYERGDPGQGDSWFHQLAGRIPDRGGLYEITRKDGWRRLVEFSPCRIDDATGGPGTVWLIADVTDRKLAEAAVRRTQAQLEAAQRIAKVGSWEYDPGKDALIWSEEFCRIVGVDPAATWPTMDLWRSLITPEDLPAVNREWEALSQQRTGEYMLRYQIRRPDGTLRTLQARGRAVLDGDGKIERHVGTVQDLTEQLTNEAALAAANQQLRLLTQKAPIAIWMLDGNGTVEFWNPAAERMFGWNEAELLGAALPPIDQAGLLGPGRNVDGDEMALLTRGGRTLAALVWTLDLGRGTMGIAVDVTEHKELEIRLRQSQKMEALGRLSGGIAHDFNNLLTMITGHASVILDELPPQDSLRENAEELLAAANRAAGLTGQLLTFSKRQVIQARVIDVNRVVNGMERLLRRMIRENIAMSCELTPGLPAIQADPAQIEQVLMNLMVNARDAMPSGGEITIRTSAARLDGSSDPPPGDYVCISVEDNGSGIDEETQRRVFEPFFSTKGSAGAGLGLSTVSDIARQAGGGVELSTRPGRGSTFRVFFPATSGSPDDDVEETVIPPAASGETVLLVEDEDGVRTMIAGALQRHGYRVIAVENAARAIEMCRSSERLDLLLSDVIMPGMNGRDLAARIGELRPDTRILLMSGYTDEVFVESDESSPQWPLLPKPFTPGSLARRVRAVLDA